MIEFPAYSLFSEACRSGLSVCRPLTDDARKRDAFGLNFSSGWPPSYQAFARMRSLETLDRALALRPHRVLEVAAGDASLCACLAARGIEVFANDLRAEYLREEVGCFTVGDDINLLPGNLFDLDSDQTGLFDLVIACEVIEHVAHPVDFLRQLRRFLTPAGHLLLTTPNGSYFRNRLSTYSEIAHPGALAAKQFKPDADGHLYLLTPAELRRISSQAGLRVDQLDLYATPFITGHCRLSMIQGQPVARMCYQLEQISQHLSVKIREKFCFLMSALIVADTQPWFVDRDDAGRAEANTAGQ
jgi:2-polyprenyl-3-methyl-5-hydroxy-6-metoxy-1,4-benzoquinol methylase